MRIQQFLRDKGLGSRRDCDAIVQSGQVFVNNVRLTEPTTQLQLGDEVRYKKHRYTHKSNSQQHTYLAFNKPKKVLCSHQKDPWGRKTLFDPPYLSQPEHKKLFYAGRLDYESRGLVLLSSDGQFIQRMSHPSNGIVKTYRVRTQKPPDIERLKTIAPGTTIDGVRYAPFDFNLLSRCRLLIQLSEGKKREIRILLRSIGYEVLDLERTAIGPYKLGGLAEGKWRLLPQKETNHL